MSDAALGLEAGAVPLAALRPLLAEVGDLKRLRVAHAPGSLAEQTFRRSWTSLVAGEDPKTLALRETAKAVAAARLGGIDAGVLRRSGLPEGEALKVLRRSFDAVSEPLPEGLRKSLRSALSGAPEAPPPVAAPGFVEALARQPRAGCTRPGSPRLVLEPPENHAEHCAAVAVYGVLLSGRFGAEPGRVFLAGLSHHLHNALLPDSGFTGEMMLGENLGPVVERLTDEALGELSGGLRAAVESALEAVPDAEGSASRAFHAADVCDRVLQMHHYAREASFTLYKALEEMDLVHEGPVKGFHERVLREAGLS